MNVARKNSEQWDAHRCCVLLPHPLAVVLLWRRRLAKCRSWRLRGSEGSHTRRSRREPQNAQDGAVRWPLSGQNLAKTWPCCRDAHASPIQEVAVTYCDM